MVKVRLRQLHKEISVRSFILLFFFVSFLLTGCWGAPPDTYKVVGNINNLEDLQDIHAVPTYGTKSMSKMRSEALQEIALSVGAQAGLAWRSEQINNTLEQNAANLDRVFNFNLMLLDHNIVPPVLVEGQDTLNQTDPTSIRISDRTYQIVSQAHFSTTPPNWHSYLWMSYTKPEKPMPGFLPKSKEERVVWRKYSTIGWQNGVDQANTIYAENLSRLKRDYTGMARYRYLLAQGMVSKPYVATTNLGVTGDDSNLRINDQILRITALPQMQTNPRKWKPIFTDEY